MPLIGYEIGLGIVRMGDSGHRISVVSLCQTSGGDDTMNATTTTEHTPPANCTCGLACAGCGKPLCQDDDIMMLDDQDNDDYLYSHVNCL